MSKFEFVKKLSVDVTNKLQAVLALSIVLWVGMVGMFHKAVAEVLYQAKLVFLLYFLLALDKANMDYLLNNHKRLLGTQIGGV